MSIPPDSARPTQQISFDFVKEVIQTPINYTVDNAYASELEAEYIAFMDSPHFDEAYSNHTDGQNTSHSRELADSYRSYLMRQYVASIGLTHVDGDPVLAEAMAGNQMIKFDTIYFAGDPGAKEYRAKEITSLLNHAISNRAA
jgi:hypothetical protein